MKALFLAVSTAAVIFTELTSGPAFAEPLMPTGDVDRIEFVEDTFASKPCVNNLPAVDFTFTSEGTGTVLVTVSQGNNPATRSQLADVTGTKTSVTDFAIPRELEGEVMFTVESAMYGPPEYKQTAMNSTVRHVTQVSCSMVEHPSVMAQPEQPVKKKRSLQIPAWVVVTLAIIAVLALTVAVVRVFIPGNDRDKR